MKRRFFLFAAPAIVAAPSLMKISALVLPKTLETTLPEFVAQFPLRSVHVRNLLLYGTYGGYDGYEIISNDWERAAQEISGITDLMRGAQSA